MDGILTGAFFREKEELARSEIVVDRLDALRKDLLLSFNPGPLSSELPRTTRSSVSIYVGVRSC